MVQKSGFHGVSLVDTRWAAGHRRSSGRRRLLQVNARSTAAKNIEVEVDKPLGLALGQKPGGGVVITVSPLLSCVFLDFITRIAHVLVSPGMILHWKFQFLH